MAYDKQRVKELLQVANLQRSMPNWEYLEAVIQQLNGAEETIRNATNDLIEAHKASQDAERNLSVETEAHRKTRDKLRDATALADKYRIALDAISKDSRGAKKIALEATGQLEKPETPTPAPTP